MGGWKCRTTGKDDKGYYDNPVQYWLVKYEEKYAIYYYFTRYSGMEKIAGWQEWVIDGDSITSSSGNIKFFTKDREVFFSFKNKTPIKMSKIENN